jgi:hypothetical protein
MYAAFSLLYGIELNVMHIQFKFIFSCLFAALVYVVLRSGGALFGFGRWFVVVSLVMIAIAFIFYNSIMGEFASEIYRSNSAYVRSEVNSAYLEKFLHNPFFGSGLGSTFERVYIPSLIEGDYLLSTGHSGILLLIVENGIIGSALIFFIIANIILDKRKYLPIKPASNDRSIIINYKYKYSILSFVILYYGIVNIIIISSIPYWEPFWLYGIGVMPIALTIGVKLGSDLAQSKRVYG